MNQLGDEGNMGEGVRVIEQTGGMGRWMLSKNVNSRTTRSRVRRKEWKALTGKVTLDI